MKSLIKIVLIIFILVLLFKNKERFSELNNSNCQLKNKIQNNNNFSKIFKENYTNNFQDFNNLKMSMVFVNLNVEYKNFFTEEQRNIINNIINNINENELKNIFTLKNLFKIVLEKLCPTPTPAPTPAPEPASQTPVKVSVRCKDDYKYSDLLKSKIFLDDINGYKKDYPLFFSDRTILSWPDGLKLLKDYFKNYPDMKILLPSKKLLKKLKEWIKKQNYPGNKTIFEFLNILVEFLKENVLYDKKLEKFYADQLKKECLSKTCGNYDKWKENYSYCNTLGYPNFKIRYKCENINDKNKCDKNNLCYFKDKKCIPLEKWCDSYNDKLNCEKARNKGKKERCFWHNEECYEANNCGTHHSIYHNSKINCKSDKNCFVTKNDDSWDCTRKTRACMYLNNHKENCLNPNKEDKCVF